MSIKFVSLTSEEKNRLQRFFYPKKYGWKCYVCGKALSNEKIVVRGRVHTKYYCVKCAEEKGLIEVSA